VDAPHPPSFASVTRSLRIDGVTIEVIDAFSAAGIRSILLKGPVLARWLYDDGAARPYVDCDLLVAPDAEPMAQAALRALRFQPHAFDTIPGDWPKHATTWNRADATTVDLHVTLGGLEAPPARVWEALSHGTERMAVAGRDVEILGPPARALLVALNAAKDAVRVPKVRQDLEQAVARLPVGLWKDAYLLAQRLDAGPAFAAGLRRTPSGEALAEALALPFGLPPTSIAIRETPPPPLAVGVNWLISSPGWKGKIGLVARKVFPPRTFMRAWKPIASRGAIGLILAYAWRPGWMAWRAGPAIRAAWRIRRGPGGRGTGPADRRPE
jgi:hypothetical protein